MDFTQITQFFRQVYELELDMYDQSFLEKSIEKRMQETRCDSPEAYYAYLEQNQGEGDILHHSLHVHYSEFFRDPLTFALLERVILPELIQRKQTDKRNGIRIWSAGCAAGQEAYSIAILLEEAISNMVQGPNYRIFATDQDEPLLDEAHLGYYPADALSNVSLKRAQTWFFKQDENYAIKPSIRQHLDFSVFDLLQDRRSCPPASIFGDFDLVFCCNVLIYYRPEYRALILDKFTHCLTPGGYLVTDESERAIPLAHRYREVYPQAAIFRVNQQKRNQL